MREKKYFSLYESAEKNVQTLFYRESKKENLKEFQKCKILTNLANLAHLFTIFPMFVSNKMAGSASPKLATI